MIIKEDDLFNFTQCPVKYKISHNGYDVYKKTYNMFLHELFDYIVQYICFHDSEKVVEKAQEKWAELYINNQVIISEKRFIEGTTYIISIVNYLLSEKNMNIIDANSPYLIEFEGTGYALSGKINMVAEVGNQLLIIDPSFSAQPPDRYIIDSDLHYTIYSKALADTYNKPVIIKNRSFKTGKEQFALRNSIHYERLESVVCNVGKAMENSITYPNMGYHCTTCDARGVCALWGTGKYKPYNPYNFK